MPGEVLTIAGGLISSLAWLAVASHRFLGSLLAQVDAGDSNTVRNVGISAGVASLIVALLPYVDRILKHREAMATSELQKQIDVLSNRLGDTIDELARTIEQKRLTSTELDHVKVMLAQLIPVLNTDRLWIVRANAMFPDKLPLPEGFGKRQFGPYYDATMQVENFLANAPASSTVIDVIEGRRSLPTPDPDQGHDDDFDQD